MDFLRRVWAPLVFFALGALCAWLYLGSPTRPGTARPADLSPEYLQDYLLLVADSYAQSHNLPLARLRLGGIDPATVQRELSGLAQQAQQQNLTPQANNVRGLAGVLQGGAAAAAAPPPAATAVATRTPLPTATPTPPSGETSYISEVGGALLPTGLIVGFILAVIAIFLLLRHFNRLPRFRPSSWLRRLRGGGPAPAGSASQNASGAGTSAWRRVDPSSTATIGLNERGTIEYVADPTAPKVDLRILDEHNKGIGHVSLQIAEILGPDAPSAPTGLELTLFDTWTTSRETRKWVLTSKEALADPKLFGLIQSQPADWRKPAIDVDNPPDPITLDTRNLHLEATVAGHALRAGGRLPIFERLSLSVIVTQNAAGGGAPPTTDDEEEDDGNTTPMPPSPPKAS